MVNVTKCGIKLVRLNNTSTRKNCESAVVVCTTLILMLESEVYSNLGLILKNLVQITSGH